MTAKVDDARRRPVEPHERAATMPGLLIEHARSRPGAVAMRHKRLGIWTEISYDDYLRRTAAVGLGLQALGVAPGDMVAVHSENRPEWLIADLAIQGIGAVTVGIYPTSPTSEVEYLLHHSEATVLIAEDEEQLDKVLAARDRLPRLRRIVVIDTRGVRQLDDPDIITFADLEALGATEGADPWRRQVDDLDPDRCAIVVYTSGTTGPPKGAMISHANLVAAGRIAAQGYVQGPADEVLSYLPLCHVAERLFSLIGAMWNGYVVNFGDGGESFPDDLREVQPTVFLGVPRVWERMLAAVEIRMGDASPLKRLVFRACVAGGRRVAGRRMRGAASVFDRVLAKIFWLLVFRSLRYKLGLGRVRVALSGAAPIAPQVLEFFWAMGVEIREGYGQTENTAVCTYTPADDVRIGKVGRPLPEVEVRIDDDGEILTRSPGVFLGYLKNDEATRETVDRAGWLHTGDVGTIDDDGYLAITDRKKDIIITAGGKNISPSEIENKLKVSPYIREAVVIGDRRKYLTALIGIEADTVGDWASRRRLAFTTYRDLTDKPEVRALVQQVVDEVNASLAQVETIKYVELIPKELDHEEGELTATQKVKRRAIEDEFKELIERMYR